MTDKIIANNLKGERIKKNISVEELAKAIDREKASVYYLERNADTNTTIKYLQYLKKNGTDLNELL